MNLACRLRSSGPHRRPLPFHWRGHVRQVVRAVLSLLRRQVAQIVARERSL